jgi:NTP pyrophosphatase (non-canonical NTP hydrolase)
VADVQRRLRTFAAVREWDRFHSPKNLVMALTGEAGELAEVFQWLTEEESASLSPEQLLGVEEEVADILIYILRLADRLDVSISDVINRKLELNEIRYPVEESRGNATKYSRRAQ